MPNWCSTTYVFNGSSNDIKILHDKIIEWTSKEFVKSDFGVDWLGNVLCGAGLKDRIDSGTDDMLRCRGNIVEVGDIYNLENKGDAFNVSTETAWVPMPRMWATVIKTLDLCSIRFAYEAEEPGCELYWIYDPNNLGVFDNDEVYIDVCINNRFYSEYCSKEWAVKEINKTFGIENADYNELVGYCELFNAQHEDGNQFIYVHEFERIDTMMD